jgi:hypothetical protein
VFTNDPKTAELTLGIKGNVWAPILLKPHHARLTGMLGEETKTVVQIKGQKQEPLLLTLDSVSIPEKVEVELNEKEKGRLWELVVKSKERQQANFRGQAKLKTNYSDKPELVVGITGNIRPFVEVRPKVVSFPEMSQDRVQKFKTKGQPMRRPVLVINNKSNVDFKIEKIELGSPVFSVVDLKELKQGRMYQIQIEAVWEKLSKGLNADTLIIHTNQKDSEVLEVPVRFEVI